MKLRTGLLLLLTIPFLAPTIEASSTTEAEAEIYAIDRAIEPIAQQRKNTRNEINKLNQFSLEADAWIARQSRIKSKIRAIEKRIQSGDYNTFDTKQLQQSRHSLKQELATVEALDGGATVGGRQFYSIAALNNALSDNSNLVKDLNIEYLNFSKQLANLDRQRDQLSANLENSARVRLPGNRQLLRRLQEDLGHIQSLVSNQDVWCLAGWAIDVAPPFTTRRVAITLLTMRLVDKVAMTPGAKFDPRIIAAQIESLRDQSNDIKEDIRANQIPLLEQEIQRIRHEIKMAENIDISGCWVIFIGDGPYPVIDVKKNYSGEYQGVIRSVGQLDFFRRGQILFTVTSSPQRPGVLDGYEHSFDRRGNPTNARLRLTPSTDGNVMNYRSDDVLTLRRCQ